MTLLDRYLFGRTVGALVRVLAALVLFYVLIDLMTHRRDNILAYDVPWTAVLSYYAAEAPQIASRMAPLAMLVAALFVLGDAAQHNEVTAALAGGIGLRRLIRMPLAAALLLTVGMWVMDETVGVEAARRARQIEGEYLGSGKRDERESVSWANLSGHWTVHVTRLNRVALTGEDAIMHSVRDDAVEHIQAGRIYWDDASGHWYLENGWWFVFAPGGGRQLQAPRRITQVEAPIRETPDDLFALEEPPETKTPGQLLRDAADARDRGMPVQRTLVDFHAKFAQPALSFVMMMLAVPFALRIRRGGLAISFGASIAIAIAYLMVFTVGMQLGYVGRLSAAPAAWLANVLFLAVGIVLFRRTPT